jgi:hypothetical protein
LDKAQRERLLQALEAGPEAAGLGADQRWTLVRVRELISAMFSVTYSLKGVALVLHGMGWTPQVPDARASDRDEDAILAWRKQTWPQVKGSRAGWARGSASQTSPRTPSFQPGPAPGADEGARPGPGPQTRLGPGLDRRALRRPAR